MEKKASEQSNSLPDFGDVLRAADRIGSLVRRTEVVNHPALDQQLGCSLWLKCEQQQTTGAFKLRGASNAIARLQEQGLRGDVATHSSGNHGAALACAAQRAGCRAYVVMPNNAVPEKIEAVRKHGGRVILCAATQQARERGLDELVEGGLHPVPPYDQADIIAGQGTAALELLQQKPDLDILLAPLGGGGLLAGSALSGRALSPGMSIFGAEPEAAADGAASFQSGQRVDSWQPDTIADGLRAIIGVSNFQIIKQQVDDILLASDQEITRAMRQLLDLTGLVVEPSAAVPLAVIGRHPERFSNQRVGIILTGSNFDPRLFPWLPRSAHVQ